MPLRTRSTSRLVWHFDHQIFGMLCSRTACGREGLSCSGTLSGPCAQEWLALACCSLCKTPVLSGFLCLYGDLCAVDEQGGCS